jgi:hypothetical protein
LGAFAGLNGPAEPAVGGASESGLRRDIGRPRSAASGGFVRWVGTLQAVLVTTLAASGYAIGLITALLALGWYTTSLNHWLLLPEALVLAAGAVMAIPWLIHGTWRRDRLGLVMGTATLGVAVAVSLLAYGFALPLKMLNSSAAATRTAQSLILTTGDSASPTCSSDQRYLHSVAPIIDASTACVERPTVALVSYHHGDYYLYYGPSGPRSGRHITYWPDSCVRHLYGPWWAVHTYNPDSTAMGGGSACPFGYSFIGGP